MRKLLVRFLKYLVSLLESDPKLPRVKELVQWAETLRVKGEKVSGERKRRQVYCRLVVEFPDANKQELSHLIEQAINGKLQ